MGYSLFSFLYSLSFNPSAVYYKKKQTFTKMASGTTDTYKT
ncbi:hypothetical protein [Aquimarina hainanensis]